MMNPKYRNFIIHEIQIPSIEYDVIYAYNIVEFGRTHVSNFHTCCYNNLCINMENGSYFVHKKSTLVYKVLKE